MATTKSRTRQIAADLVKPCPFCGEQPYHGTTVPECLPRVYCDSDACMVHPQVVRAKLGYAMRAWDARPGTCHTCGCTDSDACVLSEGGSRFTCAWANPQHTLCSACVESL